MFVASCKVLDLLPPVKMGGREMENGEGVAYGEHSERHVCVCMCGWRGLERAGGRGWLKIDRHLFLWTMDSLLANLHQASHLP